MTFKRVFPAGYLDVQNRNPSVSGLWTRNIYIYNRLIIYHTNQTVDVPSIWLGNFMLVYTRSSPQTMAKLVEQTSWTMVYDRYMKPVNVDYKSTFVEHNHFVFR